MAKQLPGPAPAVTIPEAVEGELMTSSTSWELLGDIVSVRNRMAGSPGEAAGAEIIADAYETAGFNDVSTTTFPVPSWERGSSSIAVEGEAEPYTNQHELIALPRTTDGEVTGELVDIGYGIPEDFEREVIAGNLVLVSTDTPDDYDRFVHRKEKYARAIDAGATGVLFASHLDGCIPLTGSVGGITAESRSAKKPNPGAVPAVGISKELASRLKRLTTNNTRTVTLSITCENKELTSRNIEATIGNNGGQEILVTAHIDAHDITEGAVDNGVGCALVVEIGRVLQRMETALETDIRLVVFGSEEIGLLGAHHWASTHDLDTVKAIINLDALGRSRTVNVNSHTFSGLKHVFEDVRTELNLPIEIDDEVTAHADQWEFVRHGVPGVLASSATMARDRGWGHTHADSMDKVDIRDIRDQALVLATAVATLADESRTTQRKSVEEIRAEIDEANETEMKLVGRWP